MRPSGSDEALASTTTASGAAPPSELRLNAAFGALLLGGVGAGAGEGVDALPPPPPPPQAESMPVQAKKKPETARERRDMEPL